MAKRFHFEPYVARLREQPFVTAAEFTAATDEKGADAVDGRLELRTPRRSYKFVVEANGTYLNNTLIHAIIVQKRTTERPKTGFILFAPYIPQPTGERLIQAGVNFVDDVGNIHVALEDAYYVTKLGLKKRVLVPRHRIGPAVAQVDFVLLADATATLWPIRKLAEAAGVGKTYAARIKKGLEAARLIGKETILNRKRLEQQFLTAYGDALRANLVLGTFRTPHRDPAEVVDAMQEAFTTKQIPWVLTGAAAEFEMEKYYRGETTTAFVPELPKELQHELRMVPDPRGPLTLLKMFGTRVIWKLEPRPLAHPLLVYAELLYQGGPRDLDAAELIRERYLAA